MEPVDLLTAEQMLGQLHEHGQDAGSDLSDSDEVAGWFGWEMDGDVLEVTHEADNEHGPNPIVTRRWRLVPLVDGEVATS